jgi:uncharacterized membrane protein
MSIFKAAVYAIGVATYAISSHIALTCHYLWFALVLAVCPLVIITIGYITQLWGKSKIAWTNKSALVLLCGTSGIMLLNYWASISPYASWLFLLQNVGMNAALALLFGLTLLPHKTPLITIFSTLVLKELNPAMVRYTRMVTVAWTLFFVGMCTISVCLFFFAPLAWWSIFINLLAWPLVGVMFAAEYFVRLTLHPDAEKVSIMQGIQAFTTYFSRTNTVASVDKPSHTAS